MKFNVTLIHANGEMPWLKEGDALGVILSVTNIIRQSKQNDPWLPQLKEIRIEVL